MRRRTNGQQGAKIAQSSQSQQGRWRWHAREVQDFCIRHVGVRRALEESLVEPDDRTVQVVLCFLIPDEPSLRAEKQPAENQTIENLRTLVMVDATILVDELPVLVEALICDGNAPSDLSPEVACVMRQSSEVHIGGDDVDLVAIVFPDGLQCAGSLRAKESLPALLRTRSTGFEEDLCFPRTEIRGHGMGSKKVKNRACGRTQVGKKIIVAGG